MARIGQLRPDSGYVPRLHFDTYGTVGLVFGGDVDAVAGYLARLGEIAGPYELVVEHPIDAGGREPRSRPTCGCGPRSGGRARG